VVLMNAEDGLFYLCRPDGHGGTPKPLMCNAVPEGWWE